MPFPIWPLLFSPQQYADPAAVIPQVCVLPVLSAFQVWPPATEVGDEAPEFVPFPYCPYAFEPQQYATESADIPHVCEAPEKMSAYATPQALLPALALRWPAAKLLTMFLVSPHP